MESCSEMVDMAGTWNFAVAGQAAGHLHVNKECWGLLEDVAKGVGFLEKEGNCHEWL